MSSSKHITILTGGGSPRGAEYGPVYKLIQDEAARRGFTAQLVDYVGCGHDPDIKLGLNLPDAVAKAQKDIKEHAVPKGSTLLCRSFGCDVGGYLLAHLPDDMGAFSRVLLWGPSAYHTYWNLVAKHPGSLAAFNAEAKSKGVQLSKNFWETMQPIEQSLREIKSVTIEIGYGTKDKYCDAAFSHYLAANIGNYTPCPVRVVEIVGAEHEIRSNPNPGVSVEAHERIKDEYFQLIFGGPALTNRNQQS